MIFFSGGGIASTTPLSFAQEQRLAIANGFDHTYTCQYDPESPDFGKYVKKSAKSKVVVSVSNVTKKFQFVTLQTFCLRFGTFKRTITQPLDQSDCRI